MNDVNMQYGGIFFLYGYRVASSGITSLLLSEGRTAHSIFAIPVLTLQNSTCNVLQGSELAELLKLTKLIIWDEAPMAHKFCFEALDKSLRDIMNSSNNGDFPFDGKFVVFGGDFRKILPIIPRGTRSDIVNATINQIKNGTPIMLLRNLDQSKGLCNGTRLIVTRLTNHVIEAKIIFGKNIRNIVYIPQMSLSSSQS
ncbi:hypothetical protein AAZX31_17G181200, partial [Glycine max]